MGNLPGPETEPVSPAVAGGLFAAVPPGEPHNAVLPPADLGSRVNPRPQVCCRREIEGNVCIIRNGDPRALNLLREYSFFFFFLQFREKVWADPIPVEARGVKGKEASGTKFSPKLVETK